MQGARKLFCSRGEKTWKIDVAHLEFLLHEEGAKESRLTNI